MPVLKRTKLELFQMDAGCEPCGGQPMAFVSEVEHRTGLYLTETKQLHRCPTCGGDALLDRVYPHQYVAPAEG